MRLRILAIGQRLPDWAALGCAEFLQRMGGGAQRVELLEIPASKRSGQDASRAREEEGRRLREALRPDEHIVALDERGRELTTRELADWLARRRQDGRDVALLVGGADGLAPELLSQSDEKLALSRFTLPHALARLVLVEQLYRAQSLLANHPYHRE